ncbi:leu operon leader peptide [Mixta calida]|nr:leu operon leader peptide [Pantoea sp.]QNU44167.1 leu operon leader peptide [Mixta calida]HCW47577.1 leu operon leader peptide [Erwiniaceae bacterium]
MEPDYMIRSFRLLGLLLNAYHLRGSRVGGINH